MNVLFSWLGHSDLRAVNVTAESGAASSGPVADCLAHLSNRLGRVVLLLDCKSDEEERRGEDYRDWLRMRLGKTGEHLSITLRCIPKKEAGDDPSDFNWVYDTLRREILQDGQQHEVFQRYYLIGPGTPTMAACTLIVARLAACAGEIWQADIKHPQGCRKLELPFELALQDGPDPGSHAAERAPGAQLEMAGAQVDGAIVRSASTKRAWMLAERAAASEWPVLVLGGTGSGKEVLVRHLQACGPRSAKAFMAKNCGAIPDNLIEAELFGYKRGAFTGAVKDHAGVFEQAGDGTLFLDEVGELPLNAQTKLLRVLQERLVTRLGEHTDRPIACRIVAATHRNLWQAVQEGRFRADLYYRLAGLVITLDDLERRPEDLQAMVDVFWRETVRSNPGFPGRTLGEDARQRLLAHRWPGNVRELRATLVRLAFLARGPRVTAADVELALAGVEVATTGEAYPADVSEGHPVMMSLQEYLRQCRRRFVEEAVRCAGGNKSQAARELGITPQHLGRVLKE